MKTGISSMVSCGNTKLPKTTMIFNLGPAKTCPSDQLGLCKVSSKCYAKKAERLYPAVLPYRERQADYWLTTDINEIIKDFSGMIAKKRRTPEKLRLNESGDFYSQEDIAKAEKLAQVLKEQFNIITYTYSARADLDFSDCQFLLVKGSGHEQANNGQTMVIAKDEKPLKGFVNCPGSCKSCAICSSDKKINVAFEIH